MHRSFNTENSLKQLCKKVKKIENFLKKLPKPEGTIRSTPVKLFREPVPQLRMTKITGIYNKNTRMNGS